MIFWQYQSFSFGFMSHGSLNWVDVKENGLGFVWFPGPPFYVGNLSECQISCSASNKFYASKVCQNVPFFNRVSMSFLVFLQSEVDDIEVVTPPEILEPNANAVVEPDLDPGERSSVAAEIREVAPDISR